MANFTGTFVQVLEQIYTFEVVANTEEEALKKVKEDPYEYLIFDNPVGENGIEIKDIKIDNE